MLVNGDFKALEWLGAVYLSKDQIGYQEILGGVDQHAVNQARWNLPERRIAKIFVFRLIYGGSGYSYANDADFNFVSDDPKFWDDLITEFYKKYVGIHTWHESLVKEAMETGRVVIPTGREFRFKSERGSWPRTQILNYPVQGFGADLMILARKLLWDRLKGVSGVFIVSTVHDSIIVDAETSKVDFVARSFFDAWREIPLEYEKQFKSVLDLPCKVEVKWGPNLKEQEEVFDDEFREAA